METVKTAARHRAMVPIKVAGTARMAPVRQTARVRVAALSRAEAVRRAVPAKTTEAIRTATQTRAVPVRMMGAARMAALIRTVPARARMKNRLVLRRMTMGIRKPPKVLMGHLTKRTGRRTHSRKRLALHLLMKMTG